MTGNWGFRLQLAIFLPIQTILHPHNVGQPHFHCTPTPQVRMDHMESTSSDESQQLAKLNSLLFAQHVHRTHTAPIVYNTNTLFP